MLSRNEEEGPAPVTSARVGRQCAHLATVAGSDRYEYESLSHSGLTFLCSTRAWVRHPYRCPSRQRPVPSSRYIDPRSAVPRSTSSPRRSIGRISEATQSTGDYGGGYTADYNMLYIKHIYMSLV